MVGRITGSPLIVHSRASDPLMVSTPAAIVASSPIAHPLVRAILGSAAGAGIEPEVPNSPYPVAPDSNEVSLDPSAVPGRGPSIGLGSTPWPVRGLDRGGHGATETRERGSNMTTTAVSAPVPARRGLGQRVRPAPALQVPRHVAAARVPVDRGAHHDHALLPLLRGGGGHPADAALLPHVVPVLLVPARGVQRASAPSARSSAASPTRSVGPTSRSTGRWSSRSFSSSPSPTSPRSSGSPLRTASSGSWRVSSSSRPRR